MARGEKGSRENTPDGGARQGENLSAAEQARQELLSSLSKSREKGTPIDVEHLLTTYVKRKRELEPQPPRVTDPDFGTLTCEGIWWEAPPRSIPGFGEAVSISFDVPNAIERRQSKPNAMPAPHPPAARQRAAYRSFFSDADRYRAVVEEANWRFYTEHIRDGEYEGAPKSVAGSREPSQVWKLLSSPRIAFPARDESGSWIEFTWECRWDREHGHKVILRNGKPNYVGQQGGG
jgi:hypothetical protein